MATEHFKSREAYRHWLIQEIAKDSMRFSKFRRYPRNEFPVSFRRTDLYRRLIDEVHGKSCHICGFKGRLELAHLAYFEDSVGPKDKRGGSGIKRMIEALEHPERIVRLCAICHDIFDYARKHGSAFYLRKIEQLMAKAEEMENANRTLQKPRSISA